MKKLVLALAFGLFFVAFSNAQESVKKTAETVTKIVNADAYQCPMDCEKGKTYAKPGSCPVCKMDLKKVDVNKKMSTCSGTKKKGCCASKKAAAAKKSSCSKEGAAKKSCSGKKASSCKSGAAKKSCSKGAKAKKSCGAKKA